MSGTSKEIEYFSTDELMHEMCQRYYGCVILTVRPGEKGAYTEFLMRKSQATTPLMVMHMLADGVKMTALAIVVAGSGD